MASWRCGSRGAYRKGQNPVCSNEGVSIRERSSLISEVTGDCERGVFAQGERAIRSIGFMLGSLLEDYGSREYLDDNIHVTCITRKLACANINPRKPTG